MFGIEPSPPKDLAQPRWGCPHFRTVTQGRRCTPTLGWRPQSLWDCSERGSATSATSATRNAADGSKVLRLGDPCSGGSKFFEIQRQRPMTKAIIFDLDSCLAAAQRGGGVFAPAFGPSARPRMAASRKKRCGRRSPSAGASAAGDLALFSENGAWGGVRSVNAFDAIGVHVYQLVRFEQVFHLGPDPRQQSMKSS